MPFLHMVLHKQREGVREGVSPAQSIFMEGKNKEGRVIQPTVPALAY